MDRCPVRCPLRPASINARQAETVERLLSAGLAELNAVGAEALTIRTVAQRAGVSPATAYTYLASKNHLFAELFWRFLAEDDHEPAGSTPTERLQSVTRPSPSGTQGHRSSRPRSRPRCSAATPTSSGSGCGSAGSSSTGSAPRSVSDADPAVLETLALAFSGALLQSGMGLMTYAEMADRLDSVVAVIMKGNA